MLARPTIEVDSHSKGLRTSLAGKLDRICGVRPAAEHEEPRVRRPTAPARERGTPPRRRLAM